MVIFSDPYFERYKNFDEKDMMEQAKRSQFMDNISIPLAGRDLRCYLRPQSYRFDETGTRLLYYKDRRGKIILTTFMSV